MIALDGQQVGRLKYYQSIQIMFYIQIQNLKRSLGYRWDIWMKHFFTNHRA